MGRLEPGAAGFVEVRNPNNFAVDVSSYALRGAVNFVFAPGECGLMGWAGQAVAVQHGVVGWGHLC